MSSFCWPGGTRFDGADLDWVIDGEFLEVGGVVGDQVGGSIHDRDGCDHHVDGQNLAVEATR
jgi:hypothetical protein